MLYEGDTVQIIFKAYRNGLGGLLLSFKDIAIDDVKIDETATCPAPNVLASNITFNSAELNWLGRANTSAVGYRVLAVSSEETELRFAAQNQNAVVLSGLAANTTYDAYVQDTCTSTFATSSRTLVRFTTLDLVLPVEAAAGSVTGINASVDGSGTTSDADSSIWYWGDGTNSLGDTPTYTYMHIWPISSFAMSFTTVVAM